MNDMARVNEAMPPGSLPGSPPDELAIKAMISAVQKEGDLGEQFDMLSGGSCDFGSALRPPSTTSSRQDFSPSPRILEQHAKDDTLLRIKILSSVQTTNFYVPVCLLVDRELEMRKSAASFSIGPSRWTQSRLFREWRQQVEQDISSCISNHPAPKAPVVRGEIPIVLDPENDCASCNQSHSFSWAPWLTTCIRAYYNTGTIRIPDDCIGSDILLALEFFGILYSPDQLVFDSFGGYLRVKMWSDYFTHRAKIADWVVQMLMNAPSRHVHSFVTSPTIRERACFVNTVTLLDVLDGDLYLDPARYGTTPSRAVVYEFFNHDQEEKQDSMEKLDGLMRDDFCAYVQASLPGTKVSFTLKQVSIISSPETVQRAVLRINVAHTSSAQMTVPHKHIMITPERPAKHATTTDTQASSLQYSAAFSAPDDSVHMPVTPRPTAPVHHHHQPVTPTTLGELSVDKPRPTIARRNTLTLRRSKSDNSSNGRRVTLHLANDDDDEHQDPPHIVSPGTGRADAAEVATNPWRHDEPSVDHPRETIASPHTFVRSLSEKIIRQTIADMNMDTIDHGLGVEDRCADVLAHVMSSSRPSSNTPSDEGRYRSHHHDSSENLFLPSLDLDEDYGRSRVAPSEHEARAHLQVIDDKYIPSTEEGAPLAHVSIQYPKASDGSVLSALSGPFDGSNRSVSSRRPPSIDNLSDFRTTVDAFSMTDEMSVKIGPAEEDDDEEPPPIRFEVDGSDDLQPGCVGSVYSFLCSSVVQDSQPKKRYNSRRRKMSNTDQSTSETSKAEAETDESDSRYGRGKSSRARSAFESTGSTGDDPFGMLGQMADSLVTGVTDGFRSMLDDTDTSETKNANKRVSPSQLSTGSRKGKSPSPQSDSHLRSERGLSSHSSSGSHKSAERALSPQSSTGSRKRTGRVSSPQPCTNSSKNAERGSSSGKRAASQPRAVSGRNLDVVRSKPGKAVHYKAAHYSDDDSVDDILVKISQKVGDSESPRQHLPPRPMGQGRSRPVRSPEPRDFSSMKRDVRPLDRIQNILKEPRSGHHAIQRRSKNVMKNLELLQDASDLATEEFGEIRRISRVESRPGTVTQRTFSHNTEAKARESSDEKKRANHRKGLLGFLRKK